MDAITGFVYGMSMMFFSMMAWMFWRKGSDRLFRLIMILMLIVDAQCLKDILSFYFTGFDNEENRVPHIGCRYVYHTILQLCADGIGEAGMDYLA